MSAFFLYLVNSFTGVISLGNCSIPDAKLESGVELDLEVPCSECDG